MMASNEKELQELRDLLQTAEAQRPPPPPPPPTAEEIKLQVLAALLPEARGEMQKMLLRLRDTVQRTMNQQQQDVCEQVLKTVTPAMNIVKITKEFMDRQAADVAQMPPPPLPASFLQNGAQGLRL